MRNLNFLRPRIAAIANPNSAIIGGAGTSVPLLVPVVPLEPLVDDVDVEELVLDDVEELVLLVTPEVEPPLLLDEELDDEPELLLELVAPDDVAPDDVAPDDVAPEDVAPDEVPPDVEELLEDEPDEELDELV
ncbi:MAG: hypothetical protein ABJG26_06535, partial [Marinomonas sp.]